MNIGLITKVMKAFIGVDASPDDINKPWYLTSRFWGRVMAVGGVLLYSYYGLVLDNDMVSIVSNNVEVIVNSMPALITACIAIYGVIIKLIGSKRQTAKVNAVIEQCNNQKKREETPCQ